MVMFKAKFRPLAGKPQAASGTLLQQQQQQQPQPNQQQQQPQPQVPPIEEERGPQAPVREPEPKHEPERAHA